MTDSLKIAFDEIRAEGDLKEKTIRYLHDEIRKRNKRALDTVIIFAICASFAAIIFAGAFATNLYFTPSAYVDVDVNPSIELTLNQFDRIIGTYAYNKEGRDIIASLSLTHKRYDEALIALMNAINQKGFIESDGLVSVTLQIANTQKEAAMLASIQNDISNFVNGQHHGVQIEVFSVNGDLQNTAHEQGVSPAMYLAIQELMAVDTTVTVESCRGHSINSIRQRTQEHIGGMQGSEHHGNGTNEGNDRGNGHHGGGH